MKSLLNAIRRAWIIFQIRSLEITIAGQDEALECVSDTFLQCRILSARINAKIELFKLNARLGAL